MSIQRILSMSAIVFASLIFPATGAQAQTVQFVPLTANHIAYSSVTGKVYATVPSTATSDANSIAVVDPATASVSADIPLVSSPNLLAVSDDGSALYASLDSAGGIQRVNLATQQPDYFIPLGSTSNGPFTAYDLAVQPGHPHTLAVSRVVGFTDGNVAIFDDSALRPETYTYNPSYDVSITFGSASELYTTGIAFASFEVAPSGLLPQSAPSGFIYDKLVYSPIDGFVYSSSGIIADPQTHIVQGTLNPRVPGQSTPPTPDYIPDAAHHVAYSLATTSNSLGTQYYAVLSAYDTKTDLLTGTVTIPIPIPVSIYGNSASDLTLSGDNRLAFLTRNGIYIVQGFQYPSIKGFSFSNDLPSGGSTVTGTLTLNQPSPPGGTSYSLYTVEYGDSTSTQDTIIVPAGQTSTTFPVAVASTTTYSLLSITASSGEDTQTISLIAHPAGMPPLPPNLRYVPLPVSSLIADRSNGLLYGATQNNTVNPENGFFPGNSIYALNPTTGTSGSALFIGSDPTTLAVSSDGSDLYAGIAGADAVARVDTAKGVKDFQFPLFTTYGPVPADQIVVVPGKPHSTAISRNLGDATSDLYLYDDAVPRPNADEYLYAPNVITFDQLGTHLFGFNTNVQPSSLETYTVTAQGLSRPTESLSLSNYSSLDYDDGRLYTNHGQVIDPATQTLEGTFYPVNYPAMAESEFVAPDTAHDRVYFGVNLFNAPSPIIEIFDAKTFLLLGTYSLPVGINLTDLVFYAPGQVAFLGAGGVFLLDLSSPMA